MVNIVCTILYAFAMTTLLPAANYGESVDYFYKQGEVKESFVGLYFANADPGDREYLIEFAIESNDIYQTRTASIDVARMVFDISDSTFVDGVVEVLKYEGEIIGFYTLKTHDGEFTEFEHELGHLFVKAGLQNNGLGTILFKRATSVARSKGWKTLVWLSDPDAEGFYLKMGATLIDFCDNLLDPKVPLPIFQYDL